MKKKNPLLVTLSWILTILAFIALEQASRITSSFGTLAKSNPYVLGVISLPTLAWIITFLTAKDIPSEEEKYESMVNSYISFNNSDPELKTLKTNIINYNIELNRLKKDGELLNSSWNQKLITEDKYNAEMDKLDSDFYVIHEKKIKSESRIKAIIYLSEELKNLEELCQKGIISNFSKETKRSELINDYIQKLK